MRRVYVVDGVGGIEIKGLERGDITVCYGYTEAMYNVMYPILQGRGRFDGRFKNWIVFSQHCEEVLKALDGVARRVV